VSDLIQVDTWRRLLGYMPVPMFGSRQESAFVLLNGGKGNFCLDLNESAIAEPIRAASYAWSSDVDHYIAIKGETLHLLRWDQPSWSEKYPLATIEPKIQVFQRYLESKQAPRERSVVTRAIQSFRVIRARAKSEQEGEQALLAFIGLLAKAWLLQAPDTPLAAQWGGNGEAQEAVASLLGASGLDMILEQLLSPEKVNQAAPSIELMIRHASGRIFQEAHYLAIAPAQTDLFYQEQAKLIRPASRTLGAFFTPTPLVRTLVEQALFDIDLSGKTTVHIFDPACGSGEFLREAVRQLSMKEFRGCIRVTGYDISPPACLMARFGLSAEACTSTATLEIDIQLRDSLDGQPWCRNVDVCLMNPPFISWLDMTTTQREVVTTTLAELHQKRPDMAVAFLRLAVPTLSEDGAIGAVLPASFLDGDTAAPVRGYIAETLSLKMTARLGNQAVFTDVTVDPALIVATRRKRTESATPPLLLWADHHPGSSDLALRSLRRHGRPNTVMCVDDAPQFSVYTVPPESMTDKWAPRPYKSATLLAALADLPKVGDLFSVQQGTITGLNAAFLLDTDSYKELPVEERKFFRLAVMNESISAGRLRSSVWVFYPHGSELPELATEDELASKLKHFYKQRLLPYREALIKRARITEKNWWRLSEYRKWQVEKKPKLVSTYFGLAGSFALDVAGDHVVVQGYGWVPKRALSDDRQLSALVAVLSAPLTNVLLAGVSNSLGGGQWNLSKRFVENMPMVDATKLPDELIEELSNCAYALSKGEDYDQDGLNELAYRAFRISTSKRG
jgi:adenine-specific DNA-methyltransferase